VKILRGRAVIELNRIALSTTRLVALLFYLLSIWSPRARIAAI
jgi:hypothetical protein